MAVAFEELKDSPEEIFDTRGMRATRQFKIAWTDRFGFLQEMTGSGVPWLDEQAQYPDWPGVVAMSIRFRRFHDDIAQQALADHETDISTPSAFALAIVQYESLNIDLPDPDQWPEPEDQTYFTYRVVGGAEGNIVKTDSLTWERTSPGEEPKAVEEPNLNRVHLIPVVDHSLQWHNVLNPPFATIRANIGKVNTATWNKFDAETCLFASWDLEREWILSQAFGVRPRAAWRVGYLFRERRVPIVKPLANWTLGGWNHAFRSEPKADAGWRRLEDSDGNPPYKLATNIELDKLFKTAQTTGDP